MTNVVIVESPAKAKTINKYLGSQYTVLASYGHVRNLPKKNGSIDVENDFKPKWEIDTKSKKHIDDIVKALKSSSKLILATDPDREGEAISWHILEILKILRKNIKLRPPARPGSQGSKILKILGKNKVCQPGQVLRV